MITLRYGRVRCPKCGTWYGLDETHVCATASIQIDTVAADPTTLPDPDRAHPAGLTWVEPLTPRSIVITDAPDIRPALALDAHRFWTGAHHGLAVGRARRAMDQAAIRYSLSAQLDRAPHLAVAMAEAAGVWSTATSSAAHELSGATL